MFEKSTALQIIPSAIWSGRIYEAGSANLNIDINILLYYIV